VRFVTGGVRLCPAEAPGILRQLDERTPVTRLTCEETFRRLDDFLDRELTADEMRLVREHLELCGACSSEYQFEASVLQSVRDKLRRVAAPPALIQRISQQLKNAIESDSGRRDRGTE
jgi:anti-sigma factor (TIGR02949 family)